MSLIQKPGSCLYKSCKSIPPVKIPTEIASKATNAFLLPCFAKMMPNIVFIFRYKFTSDFLFGQSAMISPADFKCAKKRC